MERRPDLYKDNKCIFCNATTENTLHVFTCNGFLTTLNLTFKEFLIKKAIIEEGEKIKTEITSAINLMSVLKIDIFRSGCQVNQTTRFSFIDIIRGLIPKTIKKTLKKFIRTNEIISKIINDTAYSLKNNMWDKWLDRCKQFINWEKENKITKADKKKKLRKTRRNNISQLYMSSKLI
jgi:hypothetical protein